MALDFYLFGMLSLQFGVEMTGEELLEEFKRGVRSFQNEDLSGVKLPGAKLSGANLTGADLTGADLSEADLSMANLAEANLSGTELTKANLIESKLSNANLSDAKLSGTLLMDSDLLDTMLARANLTNADLSRADLSRANLLGANLSGAALADAKLQAADLSDANLAWANLRGANLDQANLAGARLVRADLSSASLSGADLSGTNLSRANLSKAQVDEANLSGANLSNADLSGINLTESDLIETDLTKSILYKANLFAANLSGANLSGADLSSASLIETSLSQANLSEADLQGALAWGAELSGAELSGAKLSGADFSGADLSGARLHNVVVDRDLFIKSKWKSADLRMLVDLGAAVSGLANELNLAPKQGLTLYFYTRLTPIDRLLVDTIVASFLTATSGSDCRVAEYNELEGKARIRLEGSNPEHLAEIADVLHQRVWEQISEIPVSDPPESSSQEPAGAELTVAQQVTDLVHPGKLPALSFLVRRAERFELWADKDGRLTQTRLWELPRSPKEALYGLLCDLFTADDLRRVLTFLDADAQHHLPEPPAPRSAVALAAVQHLQMRGLLHEGFFLRVVRERPGRMPDIAFVAHLFELELPPVVVE